ncbi:MAG: hypothetical protein JEY91_14685 [Spirochaetaceae bacterium]|nr:hypothetical protein [Spirochaetaceae bacterium]
MSRIARNILLVIALLALLVSLYLQEKPVAPSLSVTPETQTETVVFAEKRRSAQLAPTSLAGHFPDEYIRTETVEAAEAPPVEVVEKGPITNSPWKFISTITRSGIKEYYFKNSRSGKILTIGENNITIENNFFIFTIGEDLYKVGK